VTNFQLLIAAMSAIGALLLLVTRFRVHAFIALLLVSIGLAAITGMEPATILPAIESGMGKTLGHIALIIPLGAMIGKLIEHTGGAAALARSLAEKVGASSEVAAVAVAAYVIGIPVFFEVGVVLLMPVLYGLASVSRRSLISYSLPACVVLLIVHGILPPHPGAVTSIALLGADIGRVLAFGLPITAVTALLCWPVIRRLSDRNFVIADDLDRGVMKSEHTGVVPSLHSKILVQQSLILVLVPIVLILVGSIFPGRIVPIDSTLAVMLTFFGAPPIALLASFGLGLMQCRARRDLRHGAVQAIVGRAIESVALVILITGAGGAFAGVLVASGIGKVMAATLGAVGLPILALGFAVTLLLRVIQGPTTVALVATAGILQPLVQDAHLDATHLALLCIAMGCGGIACSHVNDAGFWIYTRLNGLSVRDGLRSWTLGTTAAGILGFAVTSLAWWLI
jgi:GntP family gluconate:H+ symporter